MPYYKVLNSKLLSGGIYGSKPLQYIIGKWVRDPNSITNEPLRGGLFVLNNKRSATILTKKRPTAVVYLCKIGRKLRETSYLTKTDRVMLIRRVKV